MGEKIAAPIALGVRLVLGAVFVYAGIIKALHPDAFALQVENYRILGYAPSVAVSRVPHPVDWTPDRKV